MNRLTLSLFALLSIVFSSCAVQRSGPGKGPIILEEDDFDVSTQKKFVEPTDFEIIPAVPSSSPMIRWSELPEGISVRLKLATDSDCRDVQYEEVIEDSTEFHFDSLPEGELYVCASAIGDSGLELPALNNGVVLEVRKGWYKVDTTNAPSPRRSAGSVWTGKEMIVWGGATGPTSVLNTGYRYNPGLNIWTPISKVGSPSGRGWHTAVWTGKKMIVWGGWPMVAQGGIYDPATDTWETFVGANAPPSRHGHTAVWTGKEMIIHGGDTDAAANNSSGIRSDAHAYNPETDSWRQLNTNNGPGVRVFSAATWSDGKFFQFGGYQTYQATTNSGWFFDILLGNWTQQPYDGVDKRAGHVLHDIGDSWLTLLGVSGYAVTTSLGNGFRIDKKTGNVTALDMANGPSARYLPISTWTGESLFLWSGGRPASNTQLFNDAYLYYP